MSWAGTQSAPYDRKSSLSPSTLGVPGHCLPFSQLFQNKQLSQSLPSVIVLKSLGQNNSDSGVLSTALPVQAATLQAELAASVLAGPPAPLRLRLYHVHEGSNVQKKGKGRGYKRQVTGSGLAFIFDSPTWRASPSKFGFKVVLSTLTVSSHNCSSICGVGRADASSVSSKKSPQLVPRVRILCHF